MLPELSNEAVMTAEETVRCRATRGLGRSRPWATRRPRIGTDGCRFLPTRVMNAYSSVHHGGGMAEHLPQRFSGRRRQPRPSSELNGIRVRQAVRDSKAARRQGLVVAVHWDHCRRRPDLGSPRE